jgi:hypothetical protein
MICKDRALTEEEKQVIEAIAKAVAMYADLENRNRHIADGGTGYVRFINAVHRACNSSDIEFFTMMLEDSQNSDMRCPQ